MSLKSLAVACLFVLTSSAVYLDSYESEPISVSEEDDAEGKASVIVVNSRKLRDFSFGKLPRVSDLGSLDIDIDQPEIDDIRVPAFTSGRTKDVFSLSNILG